MKHSMTVFTIGSQLTLQKDFKTRSGETIFRVGTKVKIIDLDHTYNQIAISHGSDVRWADLEDLCGCDIDMNNVCKVNQNITDKFKHLDDVQYQQEYDEHCRKMSIIDSYEEEIKEVLFLSSGCVDTSSHSYKEYGLGLSPDYINLESIVDKIQALKSKRLGLNYVTDHYYYGYFPKQSDEDLYSIKFIYKSEHKDYTEYFVSLVNKYSKEFYGKEYFQRWKGSFFDSYKTLVTKDETWNMEYLRVTDTLKSWKSFTIATLIPVFGWLFILYSMYEAVRLYIKHEGD